MFYNDLPIKYSKDIMILMPLYWDTNNEVSYLFWLTNLRSWFTDCPEHHVTEGAD